MRGIEERLAAVAFGDASEAEVNAIEQLASRDPVIGERLLEYRRMKVELRVLSEVPEHQLSNERLRTVILGEGLKPAENTSGLGWAWIAVPVCAAIAAFTLLRLKSQPVEPQLDLSPVRVSLSNENVAIRAPKMKPFVVQRPTRVATIAKPGASPVGDPVASADTRNSSLQEIADRHWRRRRMPATHLVSPRWLAMLPSTMAPVQAPPDVSDGASAVAEPTPAAAADLQPISGASAQSVVVIHEEKDGSTGAQKAVEVTTNSNVVIGG